MWYKSESNMKPAIIDKTSSKKYVYVRRNVEMVEIEREDVVNTIYSYEEMKVPKEAYGIIETQINQEDRLNDIEFAITELIGGNSV